MFVSQKPLTVSLNLKLWVMMLRQNESQSICFIHFSFIRGLLVLVQPNAHVQKVIISVGCHPKRRVSKWFQELGSFRCEMALLKYKGCCCLLSRILSNLTLIIFTLKF